MKPEELKEFRVRLAEINFEISEKDLLIRETNEDLTALVKERRHIQELLYEEATA